MPAPELNPADRAQERLASFFHNCMPAKLAQEMAYYRHELELWADFPAVVEGTQRCIALIEQAFRERGLPLPD